MPKAVKIALAVLLPLLIVIGGAYGLAKIGVIPVGKLAKKNPALGPILQKAGLYKPAPKVAAAKTLMPDPLAPEKKALAAQRDALDRERAAWQSQKDTQQRTTVQAEAAKAAAAPDPKNVARLASIYEQMAADSVTKIFAKLPDDQVIAMMRRMDEKKVGEILALEAPERAARMTQALARPAPIEPTQSASAQ